MILFSRIEESFRRVEGREWALLFLWTLGVLFGILIAFSLQEWGARRDQAARHRQLMERLFEESEDDIAALRSYRDVLQGMLKREQGLAVALAQRQCPPAADFQALTTLGMMPALTAPSSVYQELMGAGGLSSIERKDVREDVAEFHTDLIGW